MVTLSSSLSLDDDVTIISADADSYTSEVFCTRWTHILDLDSFLTKIYTYHQNNGFFYMLLQEVFELNQFAFVVILGIWLYHGIRYDLVFNKNKKVALDDVIMDPGDCIENFTLVSWFIVLLAIACFGLKFIRGIYQSVQFWEIKKFYNEALRISDNNLENVTWHEVQSKVRQAQIEHRMCIYKPDLTELDIYQCILRQKNYLVAIVNKRLLPPVLKVPFFGEEVYWTKTLCYNVQWLLFWSPWSPFHLFKLRDDYKQITKREELAAELGNHILYLALCNLIFAPLILFWQLMYAFFYYADIFRSDPSKVGMSNWSLYGLLFLRHFNELDHEIQARLTRAYKPATRYLAAFKSPLIILVSQHIGFLSGSIMAVFIALTLYDENVIAIKHVITLISSLGLILAICRGMKPEENVPWTPESLLSNVMIHTHYLPDDWLGEAHSWKIKKKFQYLFQFRIVALLEDVIAPIITPYVLCRHIYPQAGDIVDFFRNFTENVVGVGDVCSFAQMDIKKHGNNEWSSTDDFGVIDDYYQAEGGKVELSLVHFKTTNPGWVPPADATGLVEELQQLPETDSFISPHFHTLSSDFVNMNKAEGPDLFSSAREMQKSVMYLHERRRRSRILRFTMDDIDESNASLITEQAGRSEQTEENRSK